MNNTNNTLNGEVELVIIDNDPITCIIQETKLRTRFMQPLHIFQDAREALNFMAEAVDRKFLILLDIDMPVMDGWDFLLEWQKMSPKPMAKVIMLSCSISKVDKERSMSFQEVIDYFEKPLYTTELEKMEMLLSSF